MATYSSEKNAVFYHIPKCAGLYVESLLMAECDFLTYNFEAQSRISFYCNFKKGIRQEFNDNLRCFLIDPESMKDCFEFTFVRNPYTRFISAYFYCKSNRFDNSELIDTIQDIIENINSIIKMAF